MHSIKTLLRLPLLLQAALARFKLWCTPPAVPPRAAKRPAAALTESGQLPVFRNGRALRDYQVGRSSCFKLLLTAAHQFEDYCFAAASSSGLNTVSAVLLLNTMAC
jgi:hypothetical protein